uniref:Uncharacterized protein n=1 Tax=Anopheles merus TaxID=30066 RepID=A0A182VI86_ANOME
MSRVHTEPLAVDGGAQVAHALVQLHLPLAQLIHLLGLLVQPGAEGSRLTQNVYLGRALLVAQLRLRFSTVSSSSASAWAAVESYRLPLLLLLLLPSPPLRFECDRRIRLLELEDRLPELPLPPTGRFRDAPDELLPVVQAGGGEEAALAPPLPVGSGVLAPDIVVEPAGVG